MASEMLKKALIVSADEEYFNIEKSCGALNWEPSDNFCLRMDNILKQTIKRRFSYRCDDCFFICKCA